MTSLARATRAARRPVIWLLRGYQLLLSPMHPQSCRFYPSCSSYAVTAIERFGVVRGVWLAARRLLRCHPWNPGGVDYVPSRWNAWGGRAVSGEGSLTVAGRSRRHVSATSTD